MPYKLITGLIFGLISLYTFTAQAENVYKPAELVNKAQPHYPDSRITPSNGSKLPLTGSTGRDVGLVELVFMIGTDGKPYEVFVTRSTSPLFEQEAARAILRYEYRPAKIQNKVVNSKGSALVTSEFWYKKPFPGIMGAPEGFHSFYNKFTKELAKSMPDEDRARMFIKKMSHLSDQTYVSLSHIELARFKYATTFGTPHEAIEALYGILQFAGIVKHKRAVLEEDFEKKVVKNLIKLLFENGRSAEVLELYTGYLERIPDLSRLYSKTIDKTKSLQKSDTVIERKLKLNERGDAHLPMFKRLFTIDQVAGSLSPLKLRCDTKFLQLDFKIDAQYALPESWGKCDLQLIGEPGTTASVLQQ